MRLPCSIDRTPFTTACWIASDEYACAATYLPRRVASSTTARISSGEYCGTRIGSTGEITPPDAMIFTACAPSLNRSRTARRSPSTPSTMSLEGPQAKSINMSVVRGSPWPPVWLKAGPGGGERVVTWGDVSDCCDPAGKRRLEPVSAGKRHVAQWRSVVIEAVEADSVGVEVSVDETRHDKSPARIKGLVTGGRSTDLDDAAVDDANRCFREIRRCAVENQCVKNQQVPGV